MDFDDFSSEKDKTKKIMQDRDKIKNQMIKKLSSLKFNENEINEVLNIIDFAEAKIEAVKVTLNGTNINTDDPTPAMKLALDEIRLLQTKMAVDIRVKINEILAYKNRAK